MSGHIYTLLCDLKVPVTGALTFWALRPHHQANRQSLSSLLGLFLGVCLGSYATMRATAGSLSDIAAASSAKAAGLLLMLLISLLSATASVFTEWVMNHSQYCHESLNLQNIKLYSIGIVLNAAYYLQSDGQLSGFFGDVCAPHWAVVLVLALMGLVTVRAQAACCVHSSCRAGVIAAARSSVSTKQRGPDAVGHSQMLSETNSATACTSLACCCCCAGCAYQALQQHNQAIRFINCQPVCQLGQPAAAAGPSTTLVLRWCCSGAGSCCAVAGSKALAVSRWQAWSAPAAAAAKDQAGIGGGADCFGSDGAGVSAPDGPLEQRMDGNAAGPTHTSDGGCSGCKPAAAASEPAQPR